MFCVQNNLAYFMHCPLVANQMARWSIAKVCFQNAKRVYIREIYVTNFGVIIISFLREFEKSFSTNLAGMCRCIEFDNCPVAWKSNLFLHLAGKFVVERDWFYRQCPSHKRGMHKMTRLWKWCKENEESFKWFWFQNLLVNYI